MAGASITITIDDKDLRQALARLAALDLRPAWKNVGLHLVQSTHDRFEAGRAPDGSPWKPLSPRTLVRKKGSGILRELAMQGGLMGSITYAVGDKELAVGTNKVYGRIHQLGGKTGKGGRVTMPARPYLGISDADRTEIAAVFEDFIKRALRPA